MADPTPVKKDDPLDKLHFFGLCQAQWMAIERELVKFMGFILVAVGWTNPDQAAHLAQGLEMLIGGLLIIRPIITQIYRNSVPQRIKEVSELPNVKGVITDEKTAEVTLASEIKVVADPDKLKGVTV